MEKENILTGGEGGIVARKRWYFSKIKILGGREGGQVRGKKVRYD